MFRRSFLGTEWFFILVESNFMTQMQKNAKREIFVVFVIIFGRFELIKIYTDSAPQNEYLNFSFVKDIDVVAKKKWLERVRKRPFVSRKFW